MLSALLLSKLEIMLIVVIAAIVVLSFIAIGCITALICIAWWINTMKSYTHLKKRVDEAWMTLERRMQKRFDLLEDFITAIKTFADKEFEPLERLISSRKTAMEANTMEEKIAANARLTADLRDCVGYISKNYSDWQHTQEYETAYTPLKNMENSIETSRQYYNGVVKSYNHKLEVFPARIVAKRMTEDYVPAPHFPLDI